MPRRTTEYLLEDVSSSLAKIARYVDGMSRDDFLADEKSIDAVVRNLEIIGEAVKNLPPDFKEKHNSVAWSQIAGLRNRIVHDYAGLDLEIIWEITATALPLFAGQLGQIKKV